MIIQIERGILVLALVALWSAPPLPAQQRGQYVAGQYGLNAGVVPRPGFTYANLAFNYSANQLNDRFGNAVPNVTGTYSFWIDANVFMFVPKFKILGGYYAPFVSVNWASGSLVGNLTAFNGTDLNLLGGGSGLADTWVEPVNFGWHFSRADMQLGYGFVAPTGKFSVGAADNVGSGYWGNNLNGGVTGYITRNKGTSANLFIDWEGHTKRSGTNFTPGQALTMDWGVGQVLPLTKEQTALAQIGFVGYDQWQVSDNGGTIGNVPANLISRYSVHAMGIQSNLMAPKHGLGGFFKYYWEYAANARVQGRTIVFGLNWTYAFPK